MLLVAANVLPAVAGIVVSVWAASTLHVPPSLALDDAPSSGLSWSSGDPRVLHWHPILMTSGFVVCGSAAVLSFRSLPFSHSTNKAIHGSLHVLAALISHGGMLATKRYYSEQRVPRTLSLHTALGGLVWALFSIVWFVSFGVFVFPGARSSVRRLAMPHHVAASLTMVALIYAASGTGVVEKVRADVSSRGRDPTQNERTVGVWICGTLAVAFAAVVTALTRRTLVPSKPHGREEMIAEEEMTVLLRS